MLSRNPSMTSTFLVIMKCLLTVFIRTYSLLASSELSWYADSLLSKLICLHLSKISRKASAAYYPTLHLELSRYIQWAALAKFELPWTVSRLIGPPPTALCKPKPPSKSSRGDSHSPHGSPSKKRTAQPPGFANLPPPNKVEPIKFE